MTNMSPLLSTILLPALVIAGGCSGASEELAGVAADLAKQQAAQQEQLLDETRKLSEASQKLVESDAEARRELAEFQSTIQQGIQTERQTVDQQREKLDDERRDIEVRRHRDPLIAAALVQSMTLLVAALPIVVLIYLFKAAYHEPPEAAVGELLVRDLTADSPLLLPGPVMRQPTLTSTAPDEPPAPSSAALSHSMTALPAQADPTASA